MRVTDPRSFRFGLQALTNNTGGLAWTLCCFLPATVWFNPCVPSENTEQRKLAAIMFTDMVGYSADGKPVGARRLRRFIVISQQARRFVHTVRTLKRPEGRAPGAVPGCPDRA